MSSKSASPSPKNNAKGLPPVKPPSGRFILQMFLVPGSIVLFAVALVLMVGWLRSDDYEPQAFLKKLDSENPDVRWRGASDLAQVLKRDESKELKTNVTFALELAERLDIAIQALVKAEYDKEKAEMPKVAAEAVGMLASANGYGSLRAVATMNPKRIEDQFQWNKLAPKRKFVQFLAAASAEFLLPAGVGSLCELAYQKYAPDAKSNILRRRQAVWALGIMGHNLRKFEELPKDKQKDILQKLTIIAVRSGKHAPYARYCLEHMKPGSYPKVPRVDAVLKSCVERHMWSDRFLRNQVALALLFWDGRYVEPTLLQLARDDGFGVEYQITDRD